MDEHVTKGVMIRRDIYFPFFFGSCSCLGTCQPLHVMGNSNQSIQKFSKNSVELFQMIRLVMVAWSINGYSFEQMLSIKRDLSSIRLSILLKKYIRSDS